jgi:hypothetical protein
MGMLFMLFSVIACMHKGVEMEDAPHKKKLLSMVTVIVAIIGSMALLGYLSIRFLPSSGTSAYTGTSRGSGPQSVANQNRSGGWIDDTGAPGTRPVRTKYVLHKDMHKQIGRSIVTYRGKADGAKIKLDVIVLDLDPQVTYSRTLDIAQAKKSFRVGDERFELISTSSLRMRVWHYN